MKKILFIIPTLQGGGAEKLLIDILKNIDYSLYEVQLMYFYKNNVYLDQVPDNVKQIVPFFIRSGVVASACRGVLKILHLHNIIYRNRIRKSADTQYDTIVSFLEGQALHFHTFLIGRSSNNVTFVHTDINKYRLSLNRQSEAEYALMDKIAFVSRPAMESFEKVFPKNGSQHIVLHNFIDIENVKKKAVEFEVEKKCFTIVCVGRFEKVKGFEILVDIALKLKENIPSFTIRFVGTGVEEGCVRNLVEENQLSEYFEFLGYQKNPYPYILNADVMLSTSLAEGFSLVICEAMALGIPVVSSKTDGAKSMLDGGNGILVDRKVGNFVEAISSLENDKSLYGSYSQKGVIAAVEYDKYEYLKKLGVIL